MLDSFIISYGTLLIINWGILITIIKKWFRSDNDANIKKLYIYFIKYTKINEKVTYYQCSKGKCHEGGITSEKHKEEIFKNFKDTFK